jgi:hypothetical protein
MCLYFVDFCKRETCLFLCCHAVCFEHVVQRYLLVVVVVVVVVAAVVIVIFVFLFALVLFSSISVSSDVWFSTGDSLGIFLHRRVLVL